MIFCGKRVARLEARISYLVDSRVIHVHEFPLINVLASIHIFAIAAHPQLNGKISAGKATTIAHQGQPRTALKAFYEVR
jgi:hypothetical protein